MKLQEITKREFLGKLKDPIKSYVLDLAKLVRNQLGAEANNIEVRVEELTDGNYGIFIRFPDIKTSLFGRDRANEVENREKLIDDLHVDLMRKVTKDDMVTSIFLHELGARGTRGYRFTIYT